MKLKLKDIFDIFKSEGIPYSLVENQPLNYEKEYSFASVKNKIKNGFYFLISEYENELQSISDSIILFDKSVVSNDSNIYFIVDNPQLIHYKFSAFFEVKPQIGIHFTSIIDPEADIDRNVSIGPFCVIGKSKIEAGVILKGSVTIMDHVTIKSGTVIEQNSVIGARGIAWIWDENGNRVLQPQFGGVVIEENCYLGTDVTIVRGSLSENSIIGKGTVIAHGTKIGHGCKIGCYVHMANNVTLAGNVTIEDRAFLGSGCVISSGVKVADGCIIGAGTVVSKSVEIEYATIVGVPGKIIKINNFETKPKGAPKPFKTK